MPAKDSYWLLRIGAGAGILGAVLAGVGNLLHPITPRDDPPGVARAIAESDLWTLIHLVIVIGIILMPAGLLAVRHSIPGERLHRRAHAPWHVRGDDRCDGWGDHADPGWRGGQAAGRPVGGRT